MVAYTTAKSLAQPANSSYVGTWDVPVNSNWGIIDAALGQTATVTLNNSPVTLSANQYQCARLVFSSTLTGNVAITFPTSFTGYYIVHNVCTGSSAFVVTLQTTAASGRVIGARPGAAAYVFNDGTHLSYVNLPDPGTYWDWAGSSVPAWVTACTVPPALNCDGTAFSSGTYPFLATLFGGTTLPDSKGRYRATLNQGSARITSSAGVDANTLFAAGGNMLTLTSSYISLISTSAGGMTDPGHAHSYNNPLNGGGAVTAGSGGFTIGGAGNTSTAQTGISIGSSIPSALPMPPSYVSGITMIWAA